jgi:hypothetical protein
MPDAAKADTKAGAIAFVKYYVGLINYAQATGDTKSLSLFESPDCRSCSKARATVDGIYHAGGSIQGGLLHEDVRQAARRPDVSGWTVFANVTFGRQVINRPTGSQTLAGGQSVLTFIVRRDADQWAVLQWSRSS